MAIETRTIKPFTKVHFKDFGTLILSQGEQEALTIEGDEDLLKEITSEVQQEVLTLGLDQDWFNRVGQLISSLFSSDKKITYRLTCANLDQIKIAGKCHLQCEALKSDQLEIKVAGLADIAFKQLDCNLLNVKISGRGDFSAAGRADRQEYRISGSGEVQALELKSRSSSVSISGQGNVNIHVEENLDLTISGLGQVRYRGQPQLHQVISGLGRSEKVD
jgi:hypothetical protein